MTTFFDRETVEDIGPRIADICANKWVIADADRKYFSRYFRLIQSVRWVFGQLQFKELPSVGTVLLMPHDGMYYQVVMPDRGMLQRMASAPDGELVQLSYRQARKEFGLAPICIIKWYKGGNTSSAKLA